MPSKDTENPRRIRLCCTVRWQKIKVLKILLFCSFWREGIAFAEINLDYLEDVRKKMPVWDHRREDIYALTSNADEITTSIDPEAEYEFGQVKIKGRSLVMESHSSYVSVNRKPVLPGHLLVIPKRAGAKRLRDLDRRETADLFALVQDAQKVAESQYGADSSTVSIQDGEAAGQTISHLHVHVLPRRPGDFERNDDVYDKLQEHDKGENIQWRSYEEMEEEARILRLKWQKIRDDSLR